MAESSNDHASSVVETVSPILVKTGSLFEVKFLNLEGKLEYSAVRVYENTTQGMEWINGLYKDLADDIVVQWEFRPISLVLDQRERVVLGQI